MSRKPDLTDMSVHGGAPVLPVAEVLDRAKIRAKGYTNMDVDKVSDLKIEWHDADNSHRDSGWYAKVGSRDMILSDQAVRGASKMIGQHDPKHWKMYPDRNAFPKALNHILDNKAMVGNRKNAKRLLVRHDGMKIRAILPFVYKIRDAADLLEVFVNHITKKIGPIQGISFLHDGDPGDMLSYRIILKQNIMPQLSPKMGQFMMVLLAMSETGANMGGSDTMTALGAFRTICTNSAVRKATEVRWNHRSKTQDKFFGDALERVEQMSWYQDRYTRIFAELEQAKLTEVKPRELLQAFHHEKLITTGHYDAAELYIGENTEDGRPVETQYDMFNVLTRAAHELPSLMARQQAETRTLHLFTEKGGIFERLRNAANERARERSLRRGSTLAELTGEPDDE